MTHLTSEKGYVFAKADKTAVYGHNLYLSSIDSKDNYVQISEKEAEKLKKKLEEEALKGLK